MILSPNLCPFPPFFAKNIHLSTLFSNSLSLCSSLNVSQTISVYVPPLLYETQFHVNSKKTCYSSFEGSVKKLRELIVRFMSPCSLLYSLSLIPPVSENSCALIHNESSCAEN
jgi:hypothetical protein